MVTKKKWKYHLILGVLVYFMGLLTDFGTGGLNSLLANFAWKGIEHDLAFYLSCIIIYFINFLYVSPQLLTKQKNIIFFIIAIALLNLLFAFTRYFIDEIVFHQISGLHNYYGPALEIRNYLLDNYLYGTKPIMYSTILFLALRFIDAKDEINELKLEQKNAAYHFLKSQISPHFLFNTLNTFYSQLIEKAPETASDIHKLSELLRYVTYESEKKFTLLSSEIEFITDYIYFYRKRYEKELHVNYEIIGAIKNQKIPSLILIHFIENLFKHGVINDSNHPAVIKIDISSNTLHLFVQNKIQSAEKYLDPGIGKENVKKRLTALIENNFSISYHSNKGIFTAKLKLPLQ